MSDPLDVLTIDQAYQAVNVSGTRTAHDEELGRVVTAVSRRLDELCGAIVVREVVEYASGGTAFVFLKHPVYSVTSVVEWSTLTVSAVLTEETLGVAGTASDYRIDRSKFPPVLVRRSAGFGTNWACGDGNVVVTYDAGRFATTEAVDARFVEAASYAVKHAWEHSASWWEQHPDVGEGSTFPGLAPGWAIPKRTLDLLGNEVTAEGLGLVVA